MFKLNTNITISTTLNNNNPNNNPNIINLPINSSITSNLLMFNNNNTSKWSTLVPLSNSRISINRKLSIPRKNSKTVATIPKRTKTNLSLILPFLPILTEIQATPFPNLPLPLTLKPKKFYLVPPSKTPRSLLLVVPPRKPRKSLLNLPLPPAPALKRPSNQSARTTSVTSWPPLSEWDLATLITNFLKRKSSPPCNTMLS